MADYNFENDPSKYYKDPGSGTTYASVDVARQQGVNVPPGVTRYTTSSTASTTPTTTPAPAPTAGAEPTLATVDENAIREQTRKDMQSSIDAINANYADLISQEKVAGQDRTGQTRAINARSGIMGSDFGNAAAQKTRDFNTSQVKSLENEQATKIAAVNANIEDRASAAIAAARDENLKKYQIDEGVYQQHLQQAQNDLRTLAEANVSFDPNNPAHLALLKQAGYDQPTGELLWNSLKSKANQVDYQYNADAGMFMGVDPVTHELKTIKVPGAGPEADAVLALLTKYPDVGINLSDSVEAAAAKVKNSAVFRKDNYIAPSSGVGANLSLSPDAGTSAVTDPVTDAAVANIIANNPGEWGHAADAIDAKFGAGTATKYDSWLRGVYLYGQDIHNISTGKPATDAQYVSAGYANRLLESNSVIDSLQNSIAGYNQLGFYAQKALPPKQQSETIQRQSQAELNFVNAVLRKESGAAISQSEYDNAAKQYFPRPGDTAATLAQKAKNRQTAIQTMIRSSGGAFQPPAGSGSPNSGGNNDPLTIR